MTVHKKKALKSYEGNRYGIVEIISDTERIPNGTGYRAKIKCDCGKIKYIRTSHLYTRKSCGCLGRRVQRISNLTNTEKQIVNGLLLSDATLSGNISKHLSITNKSREYLRFLRKNVSIFKNRKIRKVQHRINEKKYYSYMLDSLGYKDFINLHKLWYPKKNKKVPKNIKLTPSTCLHWYLGDGNNSNLNNIIRLHTEGFSKTDILLLIQKLKNNGIYSYFYKRMITKTFGYGAFLVLSRRPMIKFLKYIGECPVKYFNYKWKLSNMGFRN